MPSVLSIVAEAETNLCQLIDRAAAGEEIIITRDGLPRARLVPVRPPVTPRVPGGWEGRVVVAEDFDMPLPPELLAAFGSS